MRVHKLHACMQVGDWSKWYVVGSNINPSHLYVKQQIAAGWSLLCVYISQTDYIP